MKLRLSPEIGSSMRSATIDRDYSADFFRLRGLIAAGLPRRFERLAMPCRRFVEAVPSLRGSLCFARRLFDLRADGLTFRATVPSVEPIDRATVVRKSSPFGAGLSRVIFIVVSWLLKGTRLTPKTSSWLPGRPARQLPSHG